jgi:hypothetical protein
VSEGPKVEELEELRESTLRRFDLLGDMDRSYERTLDERFKKRAAEIANISVPHDPDGEPLVSPDDYRRHLTRLEEGNFDEVVEASVLHQRFLLWGLHHALEVFVKALAVEAHPLVGGPPPKIDDFPKLKGWYERMGIHLESIPGFDLLNSLRGRVGRAKHTGQPDHMLNPLKPGWARDALVILPTYDEDEKLSHHIDPARNFVNALTDLVERRVLERQATESQRE